MIIDVANDRVQNRQAGKKQGLFIHWDIQMFGL